MAKKKNTRKKALPQSKSVSNRLKPKKLLKKKKSTNKKVTRGKNSQLSQASILLALNNSLKRALAAKNSRKTFAYIRNLIWKNYSSKIKDYNNKTFLKQVRKLVELCADQGGQCTNKFVLKQYLKLRRKKRKRKILPPVPPKPPEIPKQKKRNTFSYVKGLIWRNHKADFVNFKDPELTLAAKTIYEICKGKGADCDDAFLLNEYDLLKQLKNYPEDAVKVMQERGLFDPQDYYNIAEVPFKLLIEVAPELYITSPMICPPPAGFVVADYYPEVGTDSYYIWFKPWVDWCNEYLMQRYGEGRSGEIYFKFLLPIFNKEQKRWETEIVICDGEGDVDSFGYTPGAMPDTIELRKISDELPKVKKPGGLPEAPKTGNEAELQRIINELNAKLKQQATNEKETELKNKLLEQTIKDRELKHLRSIKRELERTLKTYTEIGNTEGATKIIKEIDEILEKIKKLI